MHFARFFTLFSCLLILASCATTSPTKEESLNIQPTEEQLAEEEEFHCLPYGDCSGPNACGKVDAGCGIVLDCGPCPEACPDDQIRWCCGEAYSPMCPCITLDQFEACKPESSNSGPTP